MPFKSKAQMKWMFKNKPKMAKEWAGKTHNMKTLPKKTAKKKKSKGYDFVAAEKKLGVMNT